MVSCQQNWFMLPQAMERTDLTDWTGKTWWRTYRRIRAISILFESTDHIFPQTEFGIST